jgi:hypothetical protein
MLAAVASPEVYIAPVEITPGSPALQHVARKRIDVAVSIGTGTRLAPGVCIFTIHRRLALAQPCIKPSLICIYCAGIAEQGSLVHRLCVIDGKIHPLDLLVVLSEPDIRDLLRTCVERQHAFKPFYRRGRASR